LVPESAQSFRTGWARKPTCRMDNCGGPSESAERTPAAPPRLPTYLKDDWFRGWGALQQLTPYYQNAQPARRISVFFSATRERTVEPGTPLRHK